MLLKLSCKAIYPPLFNNSSNHPQDTFNREKSSRILNLSYPTRVTSFFSLARKLRNPLDSSSRARETLGTSAVMLIPRLERNGRTQAACRSPSRGDRSTRSAAIIVIKTATDGVLSRGTIGAASIHERL